MNVSFQTGSNVLGFVVERSRWCSSASIDTYGSIGWSSATIPRIYTPTPILVNTLRLENAQSYARAEPPCWCLWLQTRAGWIGGAAEPIFRTYQVSRRSCCAVSESRSVWDPWPHRSAPAPCHWTWRCRLCTVSPRPRRHTITSTLLTHLKTLKVLHF